MNKKDIDNIKIAKKINPRDFIYLGVIFLLFIIIIISFLYSTKIILNNVNKIFTQNDQTDIQVLDLNRYSLLEKKLNLPKNIINNSSIIKK